MFSSWIWWRLTSIQHVRQCYKIRKHSSRICETGPRATSRSEKGSSTDIGRNLGEKGFQETRVFFPTKDLESRKSWSFSPTYLVFTWVILSTGTPVPTWVNGTQAAATLYVFVHMIICRTKMHSNPLQCFCTTVEKQGPGNSNVTVHDELQPHGLNCSHVCRMPSNDHH